MNSKNRYIINFIYSLLPRIGVGKIFRYKYKGDNNPYFQSDFTDDNDIPNWRAVKDYVGSSAGATPIVEEIPAGTPRPTTIGIPTGYSIYKIQVVTVRGDGSELLTSSIATLYPDEDTPEDGYIVIDTGDDGSGNQIDSSKVIFF